MAHPPGQGSAGRPTAAANGNGAAGLAPEIALYRQHLLAARQFADQARVLEQRGLARISPAGLDRHRSYVSAAILASVAFLEASINDLYVELEELNESDGAGPPNRMLARLPQVWPAIERSPILYRYQLALVLADAERFHESRAPYADADSLIQLRDALVQHIPDRQAERRRRRRLERRLQNRFPSSALARAPGPWFPHRCLGAGCADWAVRTADQFSDAFCQRMSIPARGFGWRNGRRQARPARR
jgi:hypothetical protein